MLGGKRRLEGGPRAEMRENKSYGAGFHALVSSLLGNK